MQNTTPPIESCIFLENISLDYAGKHILLIPDFSLGEHEKILIEGPSGSGKSSFLRLLSGLMLPSSGTIEYSNPRETVLTRASDFTDFRSRYISLTFSEPLFFETLTVDENLRFPEIFLSLTYDKTWKDELLTILGIAPLLGSKISELSSGERDRINIIRALLYDRPFLFLDEPGAHMDRDLFERFILILEKYLDRVRPLTVIVSHSERFRSLVDRIYLCEKGEINQYS